MHIQTKELPRALVSFLSSLEFHRPDIKLTARETISPLDCGCDGRKGYFATFDLATMQGNVTWGSWGGANAFNPRNQVDLDRKDYTIPDGVIVVQGSIGYKGGEASLYVSPRTLAPLLPSGNEVQVSEGERRVLRAFHYIGSYRKEELMRCVPSDIEECVKKGLLKRNKANACQLTTLGKNILERK